MNEIESVPIQQQEELSSNRDNENNQEDNQEDNEDENDQHYSIDDVGLPKSQIMKIFKDAVPPNTMIQKEARHALGHVTVTFINYLIATATEITTKAKKKTLTANDILAAMEIIEMKEHLPALQEALDQYQQEKQDTPKSHKPVTSDSIEVKEVVPAKNTASLADEDPDTAIMLEEEINIMDIDEE
ncbi:DNA polymerase epsilon subunit 3 [Coelomomyces lativittatus]|nr:DNA polymerase epsilon subunit 3 [Coelomomyces lativittatus]KAJ1506369.1 DNA polymerase epsilon subunit 3 [Coelomomyces lativittatus]KAJ1506827.1 DNA polymerase epsilon subunit 3 [Coelomomyces lativittatus]